MARPIRLEYPGALYHVSAGGNQGHPVFQDEADRRLFLRTLAETCAKTGWQVHAYVLMANYYQLLFETPEANLAVGMKWLQGTYTLRSNLRHRLHGHLFQGRYRAVPVDETVPGLLAEFSTRLHLIPARAGLVQMGRDRLHDYAWSSYPGYLRDGAPPPAWLTTSKVLAAHGFDSSESSRYRAAMEEAWAKAQTPTPAGEVEIPSRGWYAGGEDFRRRLLRMAIQNPAMHRGGSYAASQIQTEGDLAQATERLGRGLEALGIEPATLASLPKGAPVKLVLAWWLRKTTTVPRPWLAAQLHMGDVSRVTQAVRSVERATEGDLAEGRARLRALALPAPGLPPVNAEVSGSMWGAESDFLD
jgi:REP element-mobilizing transposase RayT